VIGEMLSGRSVPMFTVSAQEVLAAGLRTQDWNKVQLATIPPDR
jgi:hypothetical protein